MARSKEGLFKRGRIWWAWVRGERVSCRTSNREAARLYKAKLERAAADPAYVAANETTFGDALKSFIDHFKTRKRSPLTLVMHERTGGHLARVLGATTRLADVQAKQVDGYIETRLAEGCSRVTLGKELTTLRQVLKVAKRHGAYPFDIGAVLPMDFSTNVIRRVSEMTDMELLNALEEIAGASWWQHIWEGPFGERRAALRNEIERRMSYRGIPRTERTTP